MRDPYTVLGVPRNASTEDIKRAYRKLAKKLHPDLNPGDSKVEQRFREASAAYDLLSDGTKRARFDRGEIDATGTERPETRFWRTYAESSPGSGPEPRRAGRGFDPGDIFSELFGDIGSAFSSKPRQRGADVNMTVTVDFIAAVKGGTRRVTLPTGKSLDIRIPVGSVDGRMLRLAGQGMEGRNGGSPGDALVELRVAPHPHFRRDGIDIQVDVPISLAEAVLGGRIVVPTLDGKVSVTVPPGSNTGNSLRLRGRGAPDPSSGKRGDQYVLLKVVLPDKPDRELSDFVERWSARHPYDVRAKAGLT